MKNKKILIILIIVTLVLSMQLVLSKNKIMNISKKTIKEMSSTTQETELNNQINTLNAEHTEYMNYIQACKIKIATAITNQGVYTSENDTVEIMISNIEKILQTKEKTIIQGIGTQTTFYNNTNEFLNINGLTAEETYTIILSMYGDNLTSGDMLQNITFSNATVDSIIYNESIVCGTGRGQIYIAKITCTSDIINIVATYPYNRSRNWIAHYVVF